MTKKLRFYKEEDNRWYVDLPGFEGDKSELEMVAGADHMLDIYSQGENDVYLKLALSEYPGADKLTRLDKNGSGFDYKVSSHFGIPYDYTLWLCDVTKYVYGQFPKFIYVQKIK